MNRIVKLTVKKMIDRSLVFSAIPKQPRRAKRIVQIPNKVIIPGIMMRTGSVVKERQLIKKMDLSAHIELLTNNT